MKPIYEPKGKAKEYADWALNIYTGCPHGCTYCFAPNVLKRVREDFHSRVEPRKNIVEETRKQLEQEKITGRTIELCFSCDPYPTGYDTTPTREIIKLLKDHGNHVQILTKGDGRRDFDLLDKEDLYGITYAGYPGLKNWLNTPVAEPGSSTPLNRLACLEEAHRLGIKTWISFEPILDAVDVLDMLNRMPVYVDHVKIGKLNYHPSDIDWAKFGHEVEALCKDLGLEYYIKESLRAEMEKSNPAQEQ